jgi:coenzyme F420-reducing hydrogenase delta subunit
LVTKGGEKTRTKHLRARMNLAKEMIDEERVQVEHISAPEMKADGLSKPYDGGKHKPFAKSIMGEV